MTSITKSDTRPDRLRHPASPGSVGVPVLAVGATHQIYRTLLTVARRRDTVSSTGGRDRGAVSLEQVLWFVAAGVSVAVIASILWSQIRNEAEKPVQSPSSP
ncbi:MAG: hypothetical protein RLZZ01_475 [Actinomycetota bacterium]